MKLKVQLPLSSSDMSNAGALVYNRDRSFTSEIPITDAVRSLFNPGQKRVYVDGYLRDGQLVVNWICLGEKW